MTNPKANPAAPPTKAIPNFSVLIAIYPITKLTKRAKTPKTQKTQAS